MILNHTNINPIYKHLGEDIGVQEAERFKGELKSVIQTIIEDPKKDSPVYTFLKGLEMPKFSEGELSILKKLEKDEKSLSDLLEQAETAKKEGDIVRAKDLFKSALKINPNNTFIKQRLVLVTYKSKKPDETTSLFDAKSLLEELNPHETTDPETLGLSGAVNKRIYELIGDEVFLETSLKSYEKGFYIKRDYYNGINLAYMYNVRAAKAQIVREEAIADFCIARRIREDVKKICESLITDKNWKDRKDKNWVFLTLAEAYIGLEENADEIIKRAAALLEGKFDWDSFNEQKGKLEKLIKEYLERWGKN